MASEHRNSRTDDLSTLRPSAARLQATQGHQHGV